jgi:hypothetical protein
MLEFVETPIANLGQFFDAFGFEPI